ncbi:MAG: NusG domain II-containing protein [Synergistaceae bacterium]|nr:NusG domain II-containing protein [Synergistaceae bacterium]
MEKDSNGKNSNRKLTRRKFIVKGDLWLLLCLLGVLAFHFFAARERKAEGERYAEITVEGQVDAVVSLSEDGVYTPARRPAVQIQVRDGAVGFVHSDCPDKICVHSGFLSTPGQSAACLPNKVVLRVALRKGQPVDSVTY